jgi:hypothetical protein
MSLYGPCLRLSTKCNTSHYAASLQHACISSRGRLQTRVFVSYNKPWSQLNGGGRLRNQYQWSTIVQHMRTPGAVTARSAMDPETSVNVVQARGHAGHSHGHHHHHDNTYLTSTNKKDPGVRITRIGLYVNLGMAVGKGVGGYVFNSQA